MADARDPVDQIQQPTYEHELRSAADFLKTRAEGFGGLVALSVMISPEFATWIAARLVNYADDVEHNRG